MSPPWLPGAGNSKLLSWRGLSSMLAKTLLLLLLKLFPWPHTQCEAFGSKMRGMLLMSPVLARVWCLPNWNAAVSRCMESPNTGERRSAGGGETEGARVNPRLGSLKGGNDGGDELRVEPMKPAKLTLCRSWCRGLWPLVAIRPGCLWNLTDVNGLSVIFSSWMKWQREP